MFSTLDSIEWNKLGFHTYMRPEEIPQAVRNLLSPDETVRQEAREFLLGGGQDFGDIYDTTPWIIPFCLEVLAQEGAPGKAELMRQLSGQGIYIAEEGVSSVHMMELCLRTYSALRAGLDLYLERLANGDHDERLAACELLRYMSDDVERLIPALLERIDLEPDVEVQVGILYCLKTLFASLEWPRFPLKVQYAPTLRVMVDEHPIERVRYAAARVSIELVSRIRLGPDHLLSPGVPDLLCREFLAPGAPIYWSEGTPALQRESIVSDLARLSDPAPLLRLLAEPDISAEQAHLLARGLLCQAAIYRVRQKDHWRQLFQYERRKEGDFYSCVEAIRSRQLEGGSVRTALQAIVATDRVWERPTNLFSYFYGLPDSRDELRKLVETKSDFTQGVLL